MSGRRVVLASILAAGAVPATAAAQNPSPVGEPAGTPFAATPIGAATGEAVREARKLKLKRKKLDLTVGSKVAVAGRLVSDKRERSVVKLQVRKPDGWGTIGRTRTKPNGRFTVRDRRKTLGSYRVRIIAPATSTGKRAARLIGRLNVYRSAHASWYGPGLYGNLLGCGGRLYAGTIGVAHKTLPCGTKVTLRRGSRSLTVRVIDRGPYIPGREYDLTQATAQRLGFVGHGPLKVTR